MIFTVITVTDELNACKVFETLNARGVRLSSTDLLKNYLFSLISTKFFEAERPSFTRILRAIAVISLRYNVICNLPTHEQETLYNDIAWKVSDGTYTTYVQVRQALRRVYPDDSQFKGAFAEKELRTTNSRNRKIVRHILFTIEKQCSGQGFDLESAAYNLEHILPEHPSDEWAYIEEAKQN